MSLSNDFENDIVLLLGNNTAIADIGDAAGLQPSGAAGNFYVACHTGDPGEAGDQSTNECTYTSYARVAVVRSGAGWTITTNSMANAALVQLPKATGGTETITHFSIGYESAGATKMIGSDTVDTNRDVTAGVTVEFEAGDLTLTFD